MTDRVLEPFNESFKRFLLESTDIHPLIHAWTAAGAAMSYLLLTSFVCSQDS